jgi:hypothetical protein
LRASTKSAASNRVNFEISSTIEEIFGDNSCVGGGGGVEEEGVGVGSAREIDEVENRRIEGLDLLRATQKVDPSLHESALIPL